MIRHYLFLLIFIFLSIRTRSQKDTAHYVLLNHYLFTSVNTLFFEDFSTSYYLNAIWITCGYVKKTSNNLYGLRFGYAASYKEPSLDIVGFEKTGGFSSKIFYFKRIMNLPLYYGIEFLYLHTKSYFFQINNCDNDFFYLLKDKFFMNPKVGYLANARVIYFNIGISPTFFYTLAKLRDNKYPIYSYSDIDNILFQQNKIGVGFKFDIDIGIKIK